MTANLSTLLHFVELPEAIVDWSWTSLRLQLIKIGTRVVRHARTVTFQLPEMAVTGPMERTIVTAIQSLRALPSCT